jgi:hypothetical protein
MPIRDYNFIEGVETATLPTAGTPSAAAHLITKQYLEDNYELSAPNVTGSRASPSDIVAGTGIAFTGTRYNNIWFIRGSGGVVNVSANPQIAAATNVGQRLRLIGRSDTNTIQLNDGTGLSLNGPCIFAADTVLDLMWDGSNWIETSRSE